MAATGAPSSSVERGEKQEDLSLTPSPFLLFILFSFLAFFFLSFFVACRFGPDAACPSARLSETGLVELACRVDVESTYSSLCIFLFLADFAL